MNINKKVERGKPTKLEQFDVGSIPKLYVIVCTSCRSWREDEHIERKFLNSVFNDDKHYITFYFLVYLCLNPVNMVNIYIHTSSEVSDIYKMHFFIQHSGLNKENETA